VEVDYDSGSRKEMKKGRVKKTSTIFFAIVIVTALFAVTLPSHNASAAIVVVHHKVATHHKAHTASKDSSGSIGEHHRVTAVIQGRTILAVHKKDPDVGTWHYQTRMEVHKVEPTASASTKSSGVVIGGMIVDGY
jgi:hypothetical protein